MKRCSFDARSKGQPWPLPCDYEWQGQATTPVLPHLDDNFLDRLPNLHQLGGTCLWMGFQLTTLGPVVRTVVVIDVAEQKAALSLVDDQSNVAADANRPEVFILGLVEPVKAHSGVGRIELQVEGSRLDGLLLLAGKAG